MSHGVIAALVPLLASACLAYPLPTAPTPVATEPPPSRDPVQVAIAISGPDSWWPDRLYVHVRLFDRAGADTRGVVECDCTQGHFEPRSWAVESRGSLLKGVAPGATITCRHGAIEGRYHVTTNDWRIITGPGQPAPPKPTPPPLPTPPPPSPTPPGGSGP